MGISSWVYKGIAYNKFKSILENNIIYKFEKKRFPNHICFNDSEINKYNDQSIKKLKPLIMGEVAEWLKAHAWKACIGQSLSWVRIPFSPPLNKP